MVTIQNFMNKDYMHFFGVFDGHGTYGHYVSKYVGESIPS